MSEDRYDGCCWIASKLFKLTKIKETKVNKILSNYWMNTKTNSRLTIFSSLEAHQLLIMEKVSSHEGPSNFWLIHPIRWAKYQFQQNCRRAAEFRIKMSVVSRGSLQWLPFTASDAVLWPSAVHIFISEHFLTAFTWTKTLWQK